MNPDPKDQQPNMNPVSVPQGRPEGAPLSVEQGKPDEFVRSSIEPFHVPPDIAPFAQPTEDFRIHERALGRQPTPRITIDTPDQIKNALAQVENEKPAGGGNDGPLWMKVLRVFDLGKRLMGLSSKPVQP